MDIIIRHFTFSKSMLERVLITPVLSKCQKSGLINES